MNAKALTLLIELVSSASTLLQAATQVNDLITKARAEGRDVSADELDALALADDATRTALADAIAKVNRRDAA